MDLLEAAAAVERFAGSDLTQTLARIEGSFRGGTVGNSTALLRASGASSQLLGAAGLMKRTAGQVNVLIHAVGILLCLPRLLEPSEVIEYLSLGAGNTGRPFDVETTHRIAEFKFIRWQGGPEVIRQNALFKDFYLLAEHPSPKRKCLYVLGTQYPLKFLNSARSLTSVLSRNVRLQDQFRAAFGQRFRTVREYYTFREALVRVEDILPWVPELAEAPVDSDDAAE